MKKLFLLLVLATFGFSNVDAQVTETPIVTYKVDTTGYANGLNIPQPHFVHVNLLSAKVGSDAFRLYSYTTTSTDSVGINVVANDSLAEVKVYPMTIPEVDTLTLDGMVERFIKKDLENIYGPSNISKQSP